MLLPKKVNEHQLFEQIWKKSATVATFINPRTGRSYDWPIFHVASPPVSLVFGLTLEREVITIRQFRHAANMVIAELPGGSSDEGESGKSSAYREFSEETGYRSALIVPLSSEPIYFEPGSLDFRFMPFLALDCEKIESQSFDANEDIEVVLYPLPRWVRDIASGTIVTDAKTMATTFLAVRKLGEMGKNNVGWCLLVDSI